MTSKWIKIGEITVTTPVLLNGTYARYAVMELIKPNGMRKYKRILMYTTMYSSEIDQIKSIPETFSSNPETIKRKP